ncbi:MAG: TonB family protein [Acidiferrobacterales bacterium]
MLFLLISAVAHVAVLAPWHARSVPKFRVTAILSVGFAAKTPAVAAAAAATTTNPSSEAKKPHAKRRAPTKVAKHGARRRPTTRVGQAVNQTAKASKPRKKRTGRNVTGVKKTLAARSATRPAESSSDQVAKLAQQRIKATPEPRAPVATQPSRARRGPLPDDTPVPLNRLASAHRIPPTMTAAAVPGLAPDTHPLDHMARVASTADARETARARIRGRLQTDLSRYFSYPAIARQRGWQGHVRVEFTVEPDGRLTHLRIARSSGYAVLDTSALKALRQLGVLAEARNWLAGQAVKVELPVIYRLEER